MTINFYSDQYGVGLFSPPSGSTTTSSSSYSLTCSTSAMNNSTTTVCSSNLNPLRARDMLLRGVLDRAEYNGHSSSPVPQSRARCRTPPAQPSVTCPGERGITSGAAVLAVGTVSVGVPQHLHGQLTQSIQMELDQQTTIHKVDTWPESFQDLRSWCHPDQDELNTPQITMQDEFNFSPEGPVNNCNWEIISSPVEINGQLINQDPLLASPSNIIVGEENNNYTEVCIQGNFSSYMDTSSMKSSVGKVLDLNSPTTMMMEGWGDEKMKGADVLWSPVMRLDESPPVLMGGGESGGGGLLDIKLNSSSRLGSGGKLILKVEKPEEFYAPVRKSLLPPVQLEQPEQPTQLHQRRLPCKPNRNKLKLNISQANNSNSLATPDVLKPLTDIPTNNFNLLQYVCGGDDSRSQPGPVKEGIVPLQDHNYTESVKEENILIKCEPLSPASTVLTIPTPHRRRSREEDEDDDDDDDDDDDMFGGDSGSEDWVPGVMRRAPATGGRRGRQASSSADSVDTPDRYRALRDRNNEASRRSRQNRKQRDMEIKKNKSDLEKRNAILRVKADRMERLVKEMRAALLISIKNSRNNS